MRVVLTKHFPDGLKAPMVEWEMSLPDAWLDTKVHFRRHGTGVKDGKITSRDLWWFPKSLKSAVELVELVNKHFKHPEMDSVRVKLTILKGD